jgi:hypothetical protein
VARADEQAGEELVQAESAQEMLQPAEFDPPAEAPAAVALVAPSLPQAARPKPSSTPARTSPPSATAPAPVPKPAAKTNKRIRPQPEPPGTYYTDEWGARYRYSEKLTRAQ